MAPFYYSTTSPHKKRKLFVCGTANLYPVKSIELLFCVCFRMLNFCLWPILVDNCTKNHVGARSFEAVHIKMFSKKMKPNPFLSTMYVHYSDFLFLQMKVDKAKGKK